MTDDTLSCSCITCGDQAIDMLVLAVEEGTGLARCVGPDGIESEVDILLLESVTAGGRLLVHAGTAIAFAPEEARS
jgi:hydrogenase maturation factor